MRKIITLFLVNAFCLTGIAQQSDFEGVVEYKVEVKSKSEGISDKIMKTMLATDDRMMAFIKHGNYLLKFGASDHYYLPQKQRVYMKFKAIDTLYYLDYSSDTTTLLNVTKLNEEKIIAGQACKALQVTTTEFSEKYFYAPALYMNPEYDKNNTIGRFDVYTKATSAIWLADYKEGAAYSLHTVCTTIEEKPVDESIFILPSLPEKKFSFATVMKPAEFKRPKGWPNYLSTTINGELGGKYIRIPKGEKDAIQTVWVLFMINENGKVLNAKVLNMDEVHPKLAEEALRVINNSPLWSPATIYGQRTIFWQKQPVSFQVSKQ